MPSKINTFLSLLQITLRIHIRKRIRFTFNLNRIHSLPEREKRALQLKQKLTWWLEKGFDPYAFNESAVPNLEEINSRNKRPVKYDIELSEAIEIARKLKTQSDRSETNRGYNSICTLLKAWAKKKKYLKLPIGDFSKAHASEYMDHCIIDRNVGPQTYNNNLTNAHVIFATLCDRGYISNNPFTGLPKKKVTRKSRRKFTDLEMKIVARAVKETDQLLFYALILQYSCLIRPIELSRLKFENIDTQNMCVTIWADQDKNKQPNTIPIPLAFHSYFKDSFWIDHPGHWFIFGNLWQPHPLKKCGERTMAYKHRKILRKLKNDGILDDIEGLSWYSWKDTGITDIIEQIGLEPARRQARHRYESTTRRYQHPKAGNEKVHSLENKIG